MKTYCLTLDLHDDPALIEEYKRYHRREYIWPEVVDSILGHGILSEEIYLVGNHMVMILHTTDEFSLSSMAAADKANPKMQEWEALMWMYQKPVACAKPGEKWVSMEKIFEIAKPQYRFEVEFE
jgi:L-rhamnose mutarotase